MTSLAYTTSETYSNHVNRLIEVYENAINAISTNSCGPISHIESVLIHSGRAGHYFGDDRSIPFQAYGHFSHWLPVNQPDQFLHIRAGEKPTYFQIIPSDFWYEQSIDLPDWCAEQFQLVTLTAANQLPRHLQGKGIAYLGEQPGLGDSLGISVDMLNPQPLLHYLDFNRAYKNEYELEQLRAANKLAVTGHSAARECFLKGGNEFQIHMAYLSACEILENECPYTNIVALDDKSAILHYQHKRRGSGADSRVLLIDAGCRVNGYGSDVTRTSVRPNVNSLFQQLLIKMEQLEKDLVGLVKPRMDYTELHSYTLRTIAELLVDLEICSSNATELLEREIPQLFMPHGVGHLLGVQVHDVGGHQADQNGAILPPPAHSPALRNTRELRESMVFTIEPGFYFIPLLLEPERNGSRAELFNWSLIDELYSCGGIRVEDNICVTNTGAENLTRQFEAGS